MEDMSLSDITVATGSEQTYTWATDDMGNPLPETLYRLREGIERFFITDINNPSASSKAQSAVVVMYDAWAGTDGFPNAIAMYNHAPQGANTLFMDGHVSFSRYPEDPPVRTTQSSIQYPAGWPLYQFAPIYYQAFGGWE